MDNYQEPFEEFCNQNEEIKKSSEFWMGVFCGAMIVIGLAFIVFLR